MKKNIKNIYLIEIIILIYIVFFNFILIKYFPGSIVISNIIFWMFITILLIILGGYPRNKNYFKMRSFKIILIILLSYVIITYSLGLILGFNTSFYSRDLTSIIKNITLTSLLIIFMELTRYLVLKHNPSRIQKYILVGEFVIFNLILEIGMHNFDNMRQFFIVTSTIIVPMIASEALLTYISNNVDILPSLLYKLSLANFVYIVPFIPNLGDYLTSTFGVILPYVTYIQIHKMLEYKEKYKDYIKSKSTKVITIILLFLTVILIVLISGLFKYQMIAIVSGSMEPIYYRGDAIIFEKQNPEDIKVGDILVFKGDNSIITHRVMKIIKSGDKYTFKTKGDNNDNYDDMNTTNEDVIGKVKLVIKYIGYPTILFNERISKN